MNYLFAELNYLIRRLLDIHSVENRSGFCRGTPRLLTHSETTPKRAGSSAELADYLHSLFAVFGIETLESQCLDHLGDTRVGSYLYLPLSNVFA